MEVTVGAEAEDKVGTEADGVLTFPPNVRLRSLGQLELLWHAFKVAGGEEERDHEAEFNVFRQARSKSTGLV